MRYYFPVINGEDMLLDRNGEEFLLPKMRTTTVHVSQASLEWMEKATKKPRSWSWMPAVSKLPAIRSRA
jgi:hypothetical protein